MNNRHTTYKPFGNLQNYKDMQAKSAESKGVLKELMAATTLTEARKIVYGVKSVSKKRGITRR